MKYRLSVEPDYLARLQNAIEQRHEDLAPTSGLNEEVFDARLADMHTRNFM